MTRAARYHLDAHHLRSIGERFRRPESALMEFIDNAWDADAREVVITLPDALSDEPIEIADNGCGMPLSEIESVFFTVGVDRRATYGSRTPGNRSVKGSKGTGRFAGFALARRLMVQTTAAGITSRFEIDTDVDNIRVGEPIDLREFPINSSRDGLPDGTVVRLRELVPDRTYPSREALAEQAMYEYTVKRDFRIVINGRPISGIDLPVVPQSKDVELSDGVTATIRI